jgi:hypothetical protein
MKKNKKHAAPLRCRLAVRRREPSPAGFVICEIGAGGCRRCEGCEHYKPDNIHDEIAEALDRLKDGVNAFARMAAEIPFIMRIPKQNRKPTEEEKEAEDGTIP